MVYYPHMKNLSQPKILVAIRLSHASWRDFLTGFLSAIRRYPHWNLRIVDPDDVVRTLQNESADALIIGDIEESAAGFLVGTDIPIVVVGSQSTAISARTGNIVFIHNDDEDIGREGAKIVQRLGARNSWGFVPHADETHWSSLRAKGFRSGLKQSGKNVSYYKPPCTDDPKETHARLLRWLLALPKPAAVMAACDAVAVRILEICKSAGIEVPAQIAVLGVDNDRLLCETARPSLSSIVPDHVHEGELTADALASLLKKRTSRPKTILCTKKAFVQRESIQQTKPATILMRRALAYIEENAASKITASDVARNLGVSRQLVELRFREFGEKTLAGTIREIRLKEVRRQLRTTKQTIRAIAANCGWTNVNHLENAFKRRFGVSMRIYQCAKP